jgi:tetratricopeptide (TPR) repeat protein
MSESTKRPFVICTYVVLILSTLLVFWQAGNFDFINYDDNTYVYENPDISNGLSYHSFVAAFTTPHVGNWLPLTWLSLIFDCQLFGLNPGRMHLVNVLLHLANTLLLFAVLKKMTGSLWPSAFVAAAFALHPTHVESVAWITERKDVLSTLFLLLTLASYVSYVRGRGMGRYMLTVLLFALGLLAKPMLVTLPLLLLLLDYWPLGRFDLHQTLEKPQSAPAHDKRRVLYRLIIEKIPFFVLATASSAVTFFVQRSSGAVADINVLSLQSRVANAFLSYTTYIGKMFWPQNLAIFYPFDAAAIQFWRVAICVLLIIVVSVLVIRSRLKQKYLFVGWFWFVLSLIPVIGLIQSGAQSMADRYTYISYIGLFIMIAWGLPELLSKWPQRNAAMGISAAIALVALGTCAHQQVSYWKNSTVLFSHAIEVTQNNDLAHNSRGVAYGELGRWQEAIEDFSQALRIKPDYAEAHYNHGVASGKLGRWQEAIEDFSQALKTKPDYAEAHYNRGVAYVKLGRWQEAIEDLNQTIKIKPDYTEAYINLGIVYSTLGRWQEAIDAYKQAITIKPNYAEAHYNLAKALVSQDRCDEAVDQYHIALQLKPDWPACMNGLAFLIATNPEIKNRDTNEALRLASRACELVNYKDPVSLGTLAAAYASVGKFSEAVNMANRAINLADATNQPQIKNMIRYHLSFYTQGKPCIKPSQKPLPTPLKP